MFFLASSVESVGEFRFGKLSELVIQGDFDRFIGFETVCLFHRQLGLVVQTLDRTAAEFPFGPKPV